MKQIHVVTDRAFCSGRQTGQGTCFVHHEKIHGGGGCASKNYIGMYGMKAASLQHDEGKEKSSGQNGNQEILQVL